MTNVTYSGATINVNGKIIALPYSVLDAYEDNGIIVILIDPDAYIGKEKNFKNLIAYSNLGKKLWEAEFPQVYKPDYYWKISNHAPLIARSFSSYECEINMITGKIIKTDFYK